MEKSFFFSRFLPSLSLSQSIWYNGNLKMNHETIHFKDFLKQNIIFQHGFSWRSILNIIPKI